MTREKRVLEPARVKNTGGLLAILLCLSSGWFPRAAPALAQTITEVSYLDFGTMAIKDNTQVYTMALSWTGLVTKDNEIAIIEPGSPAEYSIQGFLPDTLLNVSVLTPSTQTLKKGCCATTAQMTIDTFDYLPTITTDSNGDASLFVGAELRTSGAGFYMEGVYYINLLVTVNY